MPHEQYTRGPGSGPRRWRHLWLGALLLAISCLGGGPADLGEENGVGDGAETGEIILPGDYPDPPERFTATLVAPGTPHPPDPFAEPAPDGELEVAR